MVPENQTPREFAYQRMLIAIKGEYDDIKSGSGGIGLTDKQRVEVLNHIRREYNACLEVSNLDGLPLPKL